MSERDKLYGRRWRQRAKAQMRKEPLCTMCLKHGRVAVAEVADHIQPHNFDAELFWNGELQSLCKRCHDSIKQRMEKTGRYNACDINGKPLDLI